MHPKLFASRHKKKKKKKQQLRAVALSSTNGIFSLRMKKLLTSLLLVLVSQHALAAVVEVYEGVMSVLLPCKYSGFIPEDDPTVLWTRSDLHPKSVHVRREEADDLRGQNQRYSGRTSMRSDALDSLDFSLTLRNPTKTDSSNYTCSISDGTEDQRLRDIQLQVKDQQVEVEVVGGSDSVILPCQIKPELPENTTVEWTRSDRELVHVYSNRSDHLTKQDGLYRDRTTVNKDLLRTGDLSLTLKYPTERDGGGYICTIYRDKDILRQKVVLQVKEPFPSWATAVLVFLLLVVVVSALLLFSFWHQIMSFIPVEVEVEEGAESVQLPFKTTKNLPEDVKVLWERYDPRMKAHVYHDGSDLPEEQNEVYRGRTRMKGDPLRTGDLSVTVERPTERDGGEYKCLVWRRGDFIRKKTVRLRVKGEFRSRIKLLVSSSDMNHHSSTSSPAVKAVDCKQPLSHISASCHTRGLPVKVKSSSISSLCVVKLHPSLSEDDDSRWWSFQISAFGHKISEERMWLHQMHKSAVAFKLY